MKPWGWDPHDISALIRREQSWSLSPHWGKAMWGHSKAPVRKLGREFSPETKLSSSLIMVFLASRLWYINFCYFSHTVYDISRLLYSSTISLPFACMQEKQNKCLIISLYLSIFRIISWYSSNIHSEQCYF